MKRPSAPRNGGNELTASSRMDGSDRVTFSPYDTVHACRRGESHENVFILLTRRESRSHLSSFVSLSSAVTQRANPVVVLISLLDLFYTWLLRISSSVISKVAPWPYP